MKRWFIFLLTLGVLLVPGWVALGQEGEGDMTTYDFEDDLVTGDLVRPDGEILNVRGRGMRTSLIEIRHDFVAEMLKSVENL